MEYRGISFSASLALIEGCLAHEAGCRLSSREVNAYVGLFINRPSKPIGRGRRASRVFHRRLEESMQLLEFKCVEFVGELIYGHLRKKPRE